MRLHGSYAPSLNSYRVQVWIYTYFLGLKNKTEIVQVKIRYFP